MGHEAKWEYFRVMYGRYSGTRFVGRMPDRAANPQAASFFSRQVACPHSVFAAHLIDETAQPTIAVRDEILAFFRLLLAVV